MAAAHDNSQIHISNSIFHVPDDVRFPELGTAGALSNVQLGKQAQSLAADLRKLQSNLGKDRLALGDPGNAQELKQYMEKSRQLSARYEDFKKRLSGPALEVASAAQGRGKELEAEAPTNVKRGAVIIQQQHFLGSAPGDDAAAFLDFLAQRLNEN